MLSLLKNLIKVFVFFLNLWSERNAALAEKKAEIAREIVDAFQETDKRTQASRLNESVNRINRLRG